MQFSGDCTFQIYACMQANFLVCMCVLVDAATTAPILVEIWSGDVHWINTNATF